jgi:hypothetical protein
MITWARFTEEAPETEAVVRRRIEATGLAMLATVRADGSPRISPLEPLISGDRMWLGMMPGSTKVADLRRDPRCCIHTATADKDVADGDAKLFGCAVDVPDGSPDRRAYADAFKAATGNDLDAMPGGFDLFWLDLTGASSLVLGDDHEHLRITVWTPGTPEEIRKRY